MSNIAIRTMRLGDKDDLENLFATEYMAREPLERALGVDPEKGGPIVFNTIFPHCLEETLSIVAHDLETEKLIGGCCVGIVRKGEPSKLIFSKDDPIVRGIALTYEAVNNAYRGIDVYEKYGVEKYADVQTLSVVESYCAKGIGFRMTEKALEQLREKSIPLATIETSSMFSRRIAEKLGFEKLSETFYQDMVMDGEKLEMTDDLWFHQSLSAWAKVLY